LGRKKHGASTIGAITGTTAISVDTTYYTTDSRYGNTKDAAYKNEKSKYVCV